MRFVFLAMHLRVEQNRSNFHRGTYWVLIFWKITWTCFFRNWKLFTKFLIAFRFRLITNGISTICWRKCGITWNWFECKIFLSIRRAMKKTYVCFSAIRNRKANCPITALRSFCHRIEIQSKICAWKSTKVCSKISSGKFLWKFWLREAGRC